MALDWVDARDDNDKAEIPLFEPRWNEKPIKLGMYMQQQYRPEMKVEQFGVVLTDEVGNRLGMETFVLTNQMMLEESDAKLQRYIQEKADECINYLARQYAKGRPYNLRKITINLPK